MIIAKIVGGLGNQLRAFSCGYTVSRYMNQPLMLDISDYTGGYFRPFILDMLSVPDYEKIYYPHTKALYYTIEAAPAPLRNSMDAIIDTDRILNRDELLSLCAEHENIYLQGYGSIKFCTDEETALLKKWFYPKNASSCLKDLSNILDKQESVAVHIRRTDFVGAGWTSESSAAYYNAAVACMRSRLTAPQFYFFSDDIAWVYRTFGERPEYHYVNLVGGVLADIEGLFIMAACRHHILTDKSTYGWWGAFLSPHTGGINICSGKSADDDMFRYIPNIVFADDAAHPAPTPAISGLTASVSEISAPAFPVLETPDSADRRFINPRALSPEEYCALLEKKALSMLQGIDRMDDLDGINGLELLSCMDKLMQTKRDSFDFRLDYSLALFLTGRFCESVLYAAAARRIKPGSPIPRWIRDMSHDTAADDRKLYLSLSDKLCQSPPAHYFFLNINRWDNVKGFYDSLEIILRNLGNEVSVLECSVDASKASRSLDRIIASKQSLDSVYHYGIDRYRMYCADDNDAFSHAKELIERTKKLDTVKVITHFADGLICDVSPYPVYYIDGYSEWDVWKYITDSYDADTFDAICALSAKIFTARKVDPRYFSKTVRPAAPLASAGQINERTNVSDADDMTKAGIVRLKKRYANPDCYMRNDSVIREIIHIILNL